MSDPNPQPDPQKNLDPRHQRRIMLMQQLFAATFTDQTKSQAEDKDSDPVIKDLLSQIDEIDQLIETSTPERTLGEMNKLDLAVLRLIVFESKTKKTPVKVLIDEAVELAKEFGSESSPRLVNGVLGNILLGSDHDQKQQSQPTD